MRKGTLSLGLLAVLLAWGLAWGQQGAPVGKAVADTGRKVIDINTATPQDLDGLPGIGKAYTKAIIEGRPYKDKRELQWKKIVPKGTYAKIKDRITALAPKAEAKPAGGKSSGSVQPGAPGKPEDAKSPPSAQPAKPSEKTKADKSSPKLVK